MSISADILRWLHIIGATVLFGTGAGIAFFMLMAQRSGRAEMLLARATGWPLSEGWIVLSVLLYIATGLFWLPVVWIQVRIRDLARRAVREGAPLPDEERRLFRIWLALGFPAFGAVLAILWLMVTRPQIGY